MGIGLFSPRRIGGGTGKDNKARWYKGGGSKAIRYWIKSNKKIICEYWIVGGGGGGGAWAGGGGGGGGGVMQGSFPILADVYYVVEIGAGGTSPTGQFSVNTAGVKSSFYEWQDPPVSAKIPSLNSQRGLAQFGRGLVNDIVAAGGGKGGGDAGAPSDGGSGGGSGRQNSATGALGNSLGWYGSEAFGGDAVTGYSGGNANQAQYGVGGGGGGAGVAGNNGTGNPGTGGKGGDGIIGGASGTVYGGGGGGGNHNPSGTGGAGGTGGGGAAQSGCLNAIAGTTNTGGGGGGASGTAFICGQRGGPGGSGRCQLRFLTADLAGLIYTSSIAPTEFAVYGAYSVFTCNSTATFMFSSRGGAY